MKNQGRRSEALCLVALTRARRARSDSALARCAAGLILAFALIVCGDALGQEKVTQYCYHTCFNTLHEAEAELQRTESPYAGLWKRRETQHHARYGEIGYISIRYEVDDQEPSMFYRPGYLIAGNGSASGICTPLNESYFTKHCADETEGAEGRIEQMRRAWPSCTISEIGFVGSHGSPYVNVYRLGGKSGYISYVNFDAEREYKYTLWCPDFGDKPPRIEAKVSRKFQAFICPEGFRSKEVANPAYVPGGKGVEWPLICEAPGSAQTIYVHNPTQTGSTAANCNPCFPATGDKARFETDFRFAGKDFVRSYHSLGQVQVSPEMGGNWTHTYMGRVTSGWGQSRFTESGYLETYSAGRGDRAADETLVFLDNGEYELVEFNGTTRRFDRWFQLIAIGHPDPQYSVTLEHDDDHRLVRAVDGLGRTLNFAYVKGKLVSITLPDGSMARYSYDASGNLTRVIRPDGSSRQYLYGEPGLAPADRPDLMTGIIEGGKRYATFSYNEQAKVTGSHLWASGAPVDAVTISYNADGSATSVNSLGEVREHQVGGANYRQITQTSDSRGSVSFGFLPQGRRSYAQDAMGNRVTYAYVDGSSGRYSQEQVVTEESLSRVTKTTRDVANHVVEERVSQKTSDGEQLVALSRRVPDAQGRDLYTCEYDATQSADYICGSLQIAPANVRQTANTYCSAADVAATPSYCPIAGLQRSTKDAAGNDTQFEYYPANDATCNTGGACAYRKGDLRAIVNALGQRAEILEYDALGNAVLIRGVDGAETERLFDSGGRMLAETVKGDSPADDRITLYEHSATGRPTRVTGPDGVWIRMVYDTADRLTGIEDAAGNRIVYTLDAAGNRVREEVLDASGLLRRFMDRQFDTASRMTRQTGAQGQATRYRYDANGNVLEVQSPLGVLSTSTFDGAGRPKVQVGDPEGIRAELHYSYTPDGQIEQITDPKGLSTRYTYNGFGDLTGQISPDSGSSGFTVDSVGNRRTRTDARGITATYSYDALNRLVGVAYPDPNMDVGYHYDVAPAVCASDERFAKGRLSEVMHDGGRTAYCHDRFGQVTRKVQTVNGVASTLRYAYNKSGRLASLTYPDGSVADYVRDTLGRISQIGLTRPGQARQVVVDGVTYAAFGPAIGWIYGNGRQLQRPLDLDYRPQAVHDPAAGGLSLGFGYDAGGAITELKNGTGTVVQAQYAYDALGRLTQTQDGATATPIETYDYDATGNRISLTTSAGTSTYGYPAESHHLLAVDGETRDHDAAGNTTAIGGKGFTYNDANRMSAVKQDGAVAERYGYNHRGERMLRTPEGGDAQITVYDESGQWLGNYSATGQAQQQAIWLDNYPVAVINVAGAGVPEVAYIQPDHLGTPRVVIDPVRDIAIWEWSNKSEVFGDQAPANDPDGDGVAFELGLRFPGQQATDASGMFYNYQREYDPAVGRYSQSDLIGLRGGVSSYGYVGGSPVVSIDPAGLQAIPLPMPMPAPVYVPHDEDGGAYERPGDIYIYPDRFAKWVVAEALVAATHPANPFSPWIQMAVKPAREQRPDGCPAGTKPINQFPGLDKNDVHTIKKGINARPADWVGVSPDGSIWVNEGGEAADQGRVEDYLQ